MDSRQIRYGGVGWEEPMGGQAPCDHKREGLGSLGLFPLNATPKFLQVFIRIQTS